MIKMLDIKFLKEHAILSKILCPNCLKNEIQSRCFIIEHGNSLQCSKVQEHYFNLDDIISLKFKYLK